MRPIYFPAVLSLLFSGTFNLVRADEDSLSPTVQEAVNKIKSGGGKWTLTPEKTLKTITFADGSEIESEFFDLFAEQNDLESLQISNCLGGFNSTDVAKLAGLKKLKTLGFSNCRITDASVKIIAQAFPDLSSLDVSRNPLLTDASAKEIAKLKQLEVLNLLFCNFSEFGIMSIATLPKLKALDIRSNPISDGGMGVLAKMPSLRSLKHRGSVSDTGIKALTQAKGLDNLEIQDFKITGQSGQYIRQLENLTSLIVFRCEKFDTSGVLALKGLKLNRLTLRGLPVDDAAMEVFRDLPTLKRLYLNELFSVTDAGILNLAYLKDLEELDIWGIPITNQSLDTITKLPSLKKLWLRATDITDEGLEKLLTMPQLETVRLVDNIHVTPAMLQKLKDAGNFKIE